MKGKDIMTSNYTFGALVDAYDNFLVPAVEIRLGAGKSNIFQSGGASVGDIEITLSAREPSGVTFRVSNAFDVVSHKMDANIVNALKVGTVLEAALGYGSDLTTVFKGYITEYRTIYEEEPVIMVTAVDFRRLMMKNRRSRYKFQEKSYSEVFQEVVGNYSGLYDTLHVDAVDTKTELLQNGTDYDFIRDVLCRFGKRDFFVVGADVYFQKPEKPKDAFLELAWGNGLVSFEKGVRYCNEKIMAYSCQSDKTGVTASAEVKTAANTPLLVKNMHTEEWELEEGLDQTVVQNWVDKRVWEKQCKSEMAVGAVAGLPELVPGRYIKISGIDTADSGTYLIQEVRHSFDGDRFMSHFTVGAENDSILSEKPTDSWEPEGIRGVVRAVVKENWNEEQPGCVLVEFITGTEGKKDTRWLPVVQPYCGDGFGMYFLPEIDTEVIVGSRVGDANSLVVLGGLWNQTDKLPEETAGEKNYVKRIRTKGKHELLFNDDEEKGQLALNTAQKLHITMSEDKKTVVVADAEEKNALVVDGENNTIKLIADKKICLCVGGAEMLVLDGESKKIQLKADHLEEKGVQDVKLETQKLNVKGEMTELKAGGSFKINSSGIAEIKGAMVKIN